MKEIILHVLILTEKLYLSGIGVWTTQKNLIALALMSRTTREEEIRPD